MKIHIVRKGDTLFELAKRFQVDVQAILDLNPNITNPDLIMPGMKLKIPTSAKPVRANNSNAAQLESQHNATTPIPKPVQKLPTALAVETEPSTNQITNLTEEPVPRQTGQNASQIPSVNPQQIRTTQVQPVQQTPGKIEQRPKQTGQPSNKIPSVTLQPVTKQSEPPANLEENEPSQMVPQQPGLPVEQILSEAPPPIAEPAERPFNDIENGDQQTPEIGERQDLETETAPPLVAEPAERPFNGIAPTAEPGAQSQPAGTEDPPLPRPNRRPFETMPIDDVTPKNNRNVPSVNWQPQTATGSGQNGNEGHYTTCNHCKRPMYIGKPVYYPVLWQQAKPNAYVPPQMRTNFREK